MHFQPVAIGFEPAPHLRILVVGGVILNQDRSLAAVPAGQLFQECEVGARIEDGVLLVVEASAPEFDRAQDLDTLALPGDRDFGGTADSAPGGIQGGVLPEAGFVGKDQRPALGLGFFLRLGYVRRCHRSCWPTSARASTRRGRCTEKPRACSSFRTWPGW